MTDDPYDGVGPNGPSYLDRMKTVVGSWWWNERLWHERCWRSKARISETSVRSLLTLGSNQLTYQAVCNNVALVSN